MKPREVRLPDGRVWLRVADPEWADPLDPSWAQERGGRWNPPGSHPTLYLSADVATALMQIERMLEGSPVRPDDLDGSAYVLMAATLPRSQTCADAVTDAGLRALGIPTSYPQDGDGEEIGHEVCQPIGQHIRDQRLRGVWCRSGIVADGSGRELAWFPATRRSQAHPVWRRPLPFAQWRYATGWADLGLEEQWEVE